MLLRTEFVRRKSSGKGPHGCTDGVFSCDNCGCEFRRRWRTRFVEKRYHFCRRKCADATRVPGAALYTQDNDLTKRKRIATMKANKSFGKSRLEDDFYAMLCTCFEVVQRQVVVKSWAIDFYIPSIDTYVQYDGRYWHGLDRPLEVIAEHHTALDAGIHGTYIKDREQDRWFDAQGLKLLRVTDADDPVAFIRMLVQAS